MAARRDDFAGSGAWRSCRWPEELTPGAGPQPRLYALSVAVRWGSNRALELASLRAVAEAPEP